MKDLAATGTHCYLYLDFKTIDNSWLRWTIIYYKKYSSIWNYYEPRPLPDDDENGGKTLTHVFGMFTTTQFYLTAGMSNKLPGEEDSSLECKIDWIDFF